MLFLLIAAAVILFGSRTAISSWVDLLWFRSLGYSEVFWKSRAIQWGVFAGFAAATFVYLFGAFSAFKRAHSADLPNDHTIVIGGNPINLPVAPVLRLIAAVVSLIIALATGAAMQAQWTTLALFWFRLAAPAGSGGSSADPIFANRSIFICSPFLPGNSSPAGC